MTSDTLLSTIQSINIQSLPPNVTHLFASSSETTCGILEDVIHATDQISASLTAYMANPISNGKLVSNLRQNSALQRSLHLVSLLSILVLLTHQLSSDSRIRMFVRLSML